MLELVVDGKVDCPVGEQRHQRRPQALVEPAHPLHPHDVRQPACGRRGRRQVWSSGTWRGESVELGHGWLGGQGGTVRRGGQGGGAPAMPMCAAAPMRCTWRRVLRTSSGQTKVAVRAPAMAPETALMTSCSCSIMRGAPCVPKRRVERRCWWSSRCVRGAGVASAASAAAQPLTTGTGPVAILLLLLLLLLLASVLDCAYSSVTDCSTRAACRRQQLGSRGQSERGPPLTASLRGLRSLVCVLRCRAEGGGKVRTPLSGGASDGRRRMGVIARGRE